MSKNLKIIHGPTCSRKLLFRFFFFCFKDDENDETDFGFKDEIDFGFEDDEDDETDFGFEVFKLKMIQMMKQIFFSLSVLQMIVSCYVEIILISCEM